MMTDTSIDFSAVGAGITSSVFVYLQWINGVLATITLLLALAFGLWRVWRWWKKGSPYPDGD